MAKRMASDDYAGVDSTPKKRRGNFFSEPTTPKPTIIIYAFVDPSTPRDGHAKVTPKKAETMEVVFFMVEGYAEVHKMWNKEVYGKYNGTFMKKGDVLQRCRNVVSKDEIFDESIIENMLQPVAKDNTGLWLFAMHAIGSKASDWDNFGIVYNIVIDSFVKWNNDDTNKIKYDVKVIENIPTEPSAIRIMSKLVQFNKWGQQLPSVSVAINSEG